MWGGPEGEHVARCDGGVRARVEHHDVEVPPDALGGGAEEAEGLPEGRHVHIFRQKCAQLGASEGLQGEEPLAIRERAQLVAPSDVERDHDPPAGVLVVHAEGAGHRGDVLAAVWAAVVGAAPARAVDEAFPVLVAVMK